MSSTLAIGEGATRTPRLAPPAKPTRTATPRRRTVGQGASLVGRADRPVLRIVAGDERPVITRFAPSEQPIEPSVELDPSVALDPSVELVETTARSIDLQDFFASEWDGDDVSVEVAQPRPSSVRLTRRGRLAVFGASLVVVLGLGFAAASGSLANDKPEPTRVITVEPGQTLWDIASDVSDGGDVRSTMAHLEAINHLDSSTLQVGQHLRVPK
jgi:hypothetical protein